MLESRLDGLAQMCHFQDLRLVLSSLQDWIYSKLHGILFLFLLCLVLQWSFGAKELLQFFWA